MDITKRSRALETMLESLRSFFAAHITFISEGGEIIILSDNRRIGTVFFDLLLNQDFDDYTLLDVAVTNCISTVQDAILEENVDYINEDVDKIVKFLRYAGPNAIREDNKIFPYFIADEIKLRLEPVYFEY